MDVLGRVRVSAAIFNFRLQGRPGFLIGGHFETLGVADAQRVVVAFVPDREPGDAAARGGAGEVGTEDRVDERGFADTGAAGDDDDVDLAEPGALLCQCLVNQRRQLVPVDCRGGRAPLVYRPACDLPTRPVTVRAAYTGWQKSGSSSDCVIGRFKEGLPTDLSRRRDRPIIATRLPMAR